MSAPEISATLSRVDIAASLLERIRLPQTAGKIVTDVLRCRAERLPRDVLKGMDWVIENSRRKYPS